MKDEQSNQLNLTVVALVALVAIVGLVALVMNAASVSKLATGVKLAAAQPVVANDAPSATGNVVAGGCPVTYDAPCVVSGHSETCTITTTAPC